MISNAPIVVDVSVLYGRATGRTALLSELPQYESVARELVGRGSDVVITGAGPIWLYLRLAHALHGVARRLTYESGQGERVLIFNHDSESTA